MAVVSGDYTITLLEHVSKWDRRLSFGAAGLLEYLSLNFDWHIWKEAKLLRASSRVSRQALRRYLVELAEAGYIQLTIAASQSDCTCED